MRWSIWMGISLFLFHTAVAVETVHLTNQSGDVIKGSIAVYNPPAEGVKIKIAGLYKVIPFSEFTEESQGKINQWLADKKFKSSSGLRIEIEEDLTRYTTNGSEFMPGGGRDEVYYKADIEEVYYDVKVENRSWVDLKDLVMDYQIFYEQEPPGELLPSQKYRKVDQFSFDLAPKEIRTFETELVTIQDRTLTQCPSNDTYNVYKNGASKTSEGRLGGMLLRITKPSSSGKELVRTVKDGRVPSEKKRTDYEKIE